LMATGFPESKAISVKLRRHSTGVITPIGVYQSYKVPGGGFQNNESESARTCCVAPPLTRPAAVTNVVTSRFYLSSPTLKNGFAAALDFHCELFPEGGAVNDTFDYLLTHYYGANCTVSTKDDPSACKPLIVDVPALEEPRTVWIKNNVDECTST
jgi:hypothetical protein